MGALPFVRDASSLGSRSLTAHAVRGEPWAARSAMRMSVMRLPFYALVSELEDEFEGVFNGPELGG